MFQIRVVGIAGLQHVKYFECRDGLISSGDIAGVSDPESTFAIDGGTS